MGALGENRGGCIRELGGGGYGEVKEGVDLDTGFTEQIEKFGRMAYYVGTTAISRKTYRRGQLFYFCRRDRTADPFDTLFCLGL